ncbi:hypothetical protein IKG24_00010 [Candidatus Saccharibacteria bacterium]|nr:hypothetical protein [Candidatus Saccharibacteria bacterium]
MKKTISKIKCGGIIASLMLAVNLLVGFLPFASAFAEGANVYLTLSPMSQKIILTPGETYEGTINVINSASSTEPLNYEAKVGSYSPTRDNGKDDYTGSDVVTRSNYNIIMDWITIDQPTGTLEPNGTKVLTYKVQVPKNAPAGAQYASILVSDASTGKNNKNTTSIESKVQIASIIYANVAGKTTEKATIIENDMPSVLTNNKLEATSMVRNEGNIYADAYYTLQVWPMFSDEELCTNEENAEASMILPNTERYHVQSCDLPAVGIFRAKQVVKIFGEESVLEKTIMVCPVWLMILVVVIIVGVVMAIVILIKKHKKGVDTD